MKIMGLDLSTKDSGYSVFENDKLIDSGEIKASSTDVIARCYKMRDTIQEIINKHQDIEKIICEEVVPTGKNPVIWKALTKLQAAILFMLHDNFPNIQVEFIQPNSWRSKLNIKTGRGITRATLKQKDIDYIQSKFGIMCGDDEADAICIAYSSLIKDEPIAADGFTFG